MLKIYSFNSPVSIVRYCQRYIFRTFQNNDLSKHQHRHVVLIHCSHLIELL